MTGAKINTPPPTVSGLHPKVVSHETSVEQTERFLEAQSSEDFVPVEYKVVHVDEIETLEGDSFEEFLNRLGALGWELVHVADRYFIFSRS